MTKVYYPLQHWSAALVLGFIIAVAGQAQTRIPLALTKAEYAARAGEMVMVAMPDASAAILKRGSALRSHTTPEVAHGPFATADTQGNLVIAVPLLAPPGRYIVDSQFQNDGGIAIGGAVSMNVQALPPVPVGEVPVVLLNGYQLPSLFQLTTCPVSAPSDTFGNLPSALAGSTSVYWFDNCAECPDCSIESLGSDLGGVLGQIQFTDGTPVGQFDLLAHSMGGLIIRAYLSGKETTAGLFSPPAATKIRKAIFIGTPHYGSYAAGLLNLGTQATQMNPGSQFLWDLNRWNQGFDNLREVDALAIAGNGFDGGKNDGIVSLTSATILFAGFADDRTRIITGACHIDSFPLCATSQGIANSPLTIQIVQSFLSGSNTWASMGESPSQVQVTASSGGRYVSYHSAADVAQTNVGNMAFGNQALSQNPDTHTTFYNDFLSATSGMLTFTAQGQSIQSSLSIAAGGYGTTLIKNPPVMTNVRPAAAQIDTLNIAPGSLISIFGMGLAGSTATGSFPWPTRLADVTVTANGQPLQLLYAGSGQINAYFPTSLAGLVTLQLTNSLGQHTLNVMTTNASPAIFSADSSGTGIAAAIHAATGQPVTTGNPAVAGEYIEIYGTGFGSTYQSGGLAVTTLTPALNVGNTAASVSFCGMPQGAVGLYQINFVVPGGLPSGTAVPLSITLGNYASNTVTLPVR